jgi:rubrerythrin
MPDFGDPFAGLSKSRTLTKEELLRAVRFVIAAEYEAVQMYMQLAECITDEVAIAVLKEVADEERVHAGEFLRLAKYLAPDEERFYSEGAAEVEEKIEEIEKSKEAEPDYINRPDGGE